MDGVAILQDVSAMLSEHLCLPLNLKKTGVFPSLPRKYLGYDISCQPNSNFHAAKTLLAQCSTYLDSAKRLELAKKIIISASHNMRSNLRYYQKKYTNNLIINAISNFSSIMKQMKEANEGSK